MKKIISMILVFATLFALCTISVSAAREEEFLSEVALVYEDSVEEARAAIAGTDWKLWEQDLNPNADYMIDDGVYLIYKTSTDVEDAITDLRVMDMYGGYETSNYEKQLEATRAGYLEMVNDLRTVAAEFKTLYESGDEMAKLAYRQMNYYKDMKTEGGTESDMLMGDFFLNMPADDKVVQMMMESNTYVVSNLMVLIAIGISGDDEKSLSTKISELYKIKDTLTHEDYYDSAESLSKGFTKIRAKLIRYEELSKKYDITDDNIPEAEFNFINEYGAIALLLEEIKLGEASLASIIRTGEYETEDLYPIVAAFSDGQKKLIDIGMLETVLKYNAPTKPISELNAMLDEVEADLKDENGNIKPINVYIGVDRSIFKGSFAFTNGAERQQALTGETWNITNANEESKGFYIASIALGAADLVIAGFAAGIPIKLALVNKTIAALKVAKKAAESDLYLELSYAQAVAKETKNTLIAKYMPMVKPLAVTALAIAIVIAGLSGISTWYNYYNPDYTEIPNTMVDVRETDVGDKYIKYNAAKVYNYEDGRNADFNAYEGKEWNALYYTKDAMAGHCLVPNFVYKDNDATIARRHQGISMFGESEAFNLNSHVYSKNAPGVYVTIRYSNTEKAAAKTPSVIGAIFATGAIYALVAAGGAGAGVGGTLLAQRAKKKKAESTEPALDDPKE